MKRQKKFIELPFDVQDKSDSVRFIVKKENGIIICTIYDRLCNKYFTGITRCHACDTFDERIGRTIAFNKARRKELEHQKRYLASKSNMFLNAYYEILKGISAQTYNIDEQLNGINSDLNALMNK